MHNLQLLLLLVAAALAIVELVLTRGRALLGWAVLALALAFLLPSFL